MPIKPMLGEIELQQVQKIETDEDQVLTQHSVPALEGDFLQGLGRRATRITLSGVMTGADTGTNLKTLRDKYREGVPVSFVADIATATKIDQVFIEELGVRELAGKPARFEYTLTLREMIPPPPHESEIPPQPPEPPDPIDPDLGTLVVEVIVENEPDFDFSTVTVSAEGPTGRIVLTNRENNFWTEQGMQPGEYTARAVVTEPEAMTGQAPATVRGGQTTQVQITLRRGVNIAKAFIIHFRFDSAFFEPCMREVLERVFTYAQAHQSEKIVVVGHTDKTGLPDYNQFLSERRARSVFAFMTFGTSPALRAAAITDWNQLWRPHAAGLQDNWDVREYQYMLQDLEYYSGDIFEVYSSTANEAQERTAAINRTRPAVRAFQSDHGLPATGNVDPPTWTALVTAYLEAGALELPEDRFLRNANPGKSCDSGMLKWLGCGEEDPVKNIEDAWRPNRRVEILFVRTETVPCKVPEPVTFNQPQPGAVNSQWCLGPGNVANRHCFITRPEPNEQPDPNKWQVFPAEPDTVTVSGTVKFAENNSPYANKEYVLIAPDGKFLHTKQGGEDKGEVASGPLRGRGMPMRTDDQGNFNHPKPTPVGIYILQLPKLGEPAVARANEDPPSTAIGNVTCMHIELPGAQGGDAQQSLAPSAAQTGSASTGGTIHLQRPPSVAVNPTITASRQVIVVKKTYTNPARLPITLRVSARFRRSGTLTRTVTAAGGNVRLFTAAQGGTEITFDGTDNVFTGNSLNARVQLFAESDRVSGALNDIQLTLTLDAGPTPVGGPAILSLTAVALQLDVSPPRVAPASFVPLSQPPATAPAPGTTATDKWFGGVVLNQQDAGNNQKRGQLLVVQVFPTAFAGDLVLRQVRVAGDNITGLDTKLQLFDDETPGPRRTPPAAERAKANPFEFNTSTVISPIGRAFFIQGSRVSGALRDTGFQLGIKNVENDGDRVAATVAITATITLASSIVVVKKPHTNPARQLVTLKTTALFNRTGTLTRSSNAIRFFTAAQGGTEITFNGTDNVFSGAELTAGKQLFAEGASPSPSVDNFQLTLTLDPNGLPITAPPVTVRMTAVELTLDICVPRTSPSTDPAPLSATDKINSGRLVQVRDANNNHVRAMMIVRPPNPLVPVTLTLTPINNRVRAFTPEVPASGQTPLANPHTILSGIIPAGGTRFFAEGMSVSPAPRNTGFRLGIQGLEAECDRVAITVFDLGIVSNTAQSGAALNRVQIEGVLNRDRISFDRTDLFGTQANSLFRPRVDLSGITGPNVAVRLVSRRQDGTEIEARDLLLPRSAGNRFVSSIPILAIPRAIPRAEITFRAPQDLEVIRSEAGGSIRLEMAGASAGTGVARVGVRGRVVEMCSITIVGASPNIAGNLTTANRVMGQVGIEFRITGLPSVDNVTLVDIAQSDCPLTIGGDTSRGTEETTLFALGRAACTSSLIIYFVRSNSLGLFGCSAFPTGSPGVTVADTATQYTFCHEVGHVLHLPHDGRANNLMTGGGTNSLPADPANVLLLPDQLQTIEASGFMVFLGGN